VPRPQSLRTHSPGRDAPGSIRASRFRMSLSLVKPFVGRDQEKLRSFPQIFGIGAFSWQKVTGAPCSRPATWYGTVRCVMSVGDVHIHATSEGL
jgi:hypothetical protein